MALVVIVVSLALMWLFPVVRCTVFNVVPVLKNIPVDVFFYYRHKMYNLCKTGELIAYVGLFGKGKTLSAVHSITKKYKRYNDKLVWCMRRKCFVIQKIKVISNVELNIPYERFISLEQVILCAETNQLYDDENNTLTVTLVLGDEFSVQMNSRNFKSNIDPLFLNTLLTCRHYHISLYYTAQRFQHVDALLRQVTSYVLSCDKVWRYQQLSQYSAWEMENAANPALLKPQKRFCWFVKNSDYSAYDTLACVGNLKKSIQAGDMLTTEEILTLQCNQPANMQAVEKPSKGWMRTQRKTRKAG